eukprot:5178395-Prymnesium_polylepis.1
MCDGGGMRGVWKRYIRRATSGAPRRRCSASTCVPALIELLVPFAYENTGLTREYCSARRVTGVHLWGL